MEWLRDKRVFVTGGSSGIGLALAREIVQSGGHVALAARSVAKLDEAAEALRKLAPEAKVLTVPLDVSDAGACEAAAERVVTELGGIDVVINNAGIAHPSRFLETEHEVFTRMMATNYFGVVNVCKAFAPKLVAQKRGHICNVSSLAGVLGIFGYTAYSASKFAVAGFSECLRQDLLPQGVAVSVVFPPDTDTPQLAAENLIKPPETKAIAGNVKVLPAEVVAHATLRGIAAGRFHIVPGFGARFTVFMTRHFPWLVRWFIDADLRRYLRKSAAASG